MVRVKCWVGVLRKWRLLGLCSREKRRFLAPSACWHTYRTHEKEFPTLKDIQWTYNENTCMPSRNVHYNNHLTVGQCSDREGYPHLSVKWDLFITPSPFSRSTAILGSASSFLEGQQPVYWFLLTLVFPMLKECQHFYTYNLKKPLSMLSHMIPLKAFFRSDALLTEKIGGSKVWSTSFKLNIGDLFILQCCSWGFNLYSYSQYVV